MSRPSDGPGNRPALHHLVSVPNRSERQPARDISGTTLSGALVHLPLAVPGRWTLLLFLGSRCQACTSFWGAAFTPTVLGIHPSDHLLVVTRSSELEEPLVVGRLLEAGERAARDGAGDHLLPGAVGAGGGLLPGAAAPDVVMSSDAWPSYGVQGPPFFSLVHGLVVATEGVAWSVDQVRTDVARRRDASPRSTVTAP